MAKNVDYRSRAKHIDLRYHCVRDAVQDGMLKMKNMPTDQQLADFMTILIPTPQITKLVKLSGIVEDPEICAFIPVTDGDPPSIIDAIAMAHLRAKSLDCMKPSFF